MTELTRNGRVRREVQGGRFGALIIDARAEGLYVRQKGKRTAYGPLSWEALFVQGGRRTADLARKERTPRRGRLAVGL